MQYVFRFAPLLVIAIVSVSIGIVVPFISFGQSEPDRITGFAWSETIGWISLDCSTGGDCDDVDHGFVLDGSGAVSGYAWSENIGWVSANPADVAGCPTAPCAPRVFEGTMTGWLKVLSGGTAESGGWDGWISLNGTTGEGGTYGIKVNEDGTFKSCESDSSCAWGSTVVGWVDFSHAQIGKRLPPPLTCSIKVPSAPVAPGASFNLTYKTSKKAVSASIDRDIGNVTLYEGTLTRTAPSTPGKYTYTMTVEDADDETLQCTSALTVKKPPVCEPVETYCNESKGKWCATFAGSCIEECWGSCSPGGEALIDISVSPSLVRRNGTTKVKWTTANVHSCVVTENNPNIVDGWEKDQSTPGGETSKPIPGRTTYTIRCTDPIGDDVSDSATVNIIPSFEER